MNPLGHDPSRFSIAASQGADGREEILGFGQMEQKSQGTQGAGREWELRSLVVEQQHRCVMEQDGEHEMRALTEYGAFRSWLLGPGGLLSQTEWPCMHVCMRRAAVCGPVVVVVVIPEYERGEVSGLYWWRLLKPGALKETQHICVLFLGASLPDACSRHHSMANLFCWQSP
eukprot:scaffold162815_cov17-Tisochrysis_lutea.AAC.1